MSTVPTPPAPAPAPSDDGWLLGLGIVLGCFLASIAIPLGAAILSHLRWVSP